MVRPRELCHPPTTVQIDHALVVCLRPEAARRDVPVVRLILMICSTRSRETGLQGPCTTPTPCPTMAICPARKPPQPRLAP